MQPHLQFLQVKKKYETSLFNIEYLIKLYHISILNITKKIYHIILRFRTIKLLILFANK